MREIYLSFLGPVNTESKPMTKYFLTTTAMIFWVAAAAQAEETVSPYNYQPINSCITDGDRVWIQDLGEQAAVLYFYNSPSECSATRRFTITSDNGISAYVVIIPNAGSDKTEKITITPDNGQHFVYPTDEDYVPDQTMAHKYTIAGGLS